MLTRPIAAMIFVVCATTLYALDRAKDRPWDLTTVCAVTAEPEKFDGQSVTVSAIVFSDGHHGSFLFDEACGQKGIHLYVESNATGNDQLSAALNWCHLSSRGKFISGTFTGIFHFSPADVGDPPRPTIRVNRIADLVLRSTREVSWSFPTPCPDAPPIDSLLHQP
jgi:hypothetical protein